jgi:osmotically-inducible protein OsmY
MRVDSDVEREVIAELRNNADIEATTLACQVKDGVVRLRGFVRNRFQKHEAGRTAWGVAGVTAVANDIVVGPGPSGVPTDAEIAHGIVTRLKFWLPESWEQIKAVVEQGHVVLEGMVAWHYERDRAEGVARSVKGVSSVGNSIRVVPLVAADAVGQAIEEAFLHRAEEDAHRVAVNANGTEVTLRGRVRTWEEREQAQRSAWSAPGVTKVTNNLRVRP